MSRILLYTTQFCGYCRAAKGLRTVPQIFIHGRHVGGYDELAALEREGKLNDWLANMLEASAPKELADASGP